LDPFPLQLGVSLGILRSGLRKAVLSAVQFDIEPGLDAKKVQNMLSKRMLSAELVFGESPPTQPPPQQLLSPSVALAKGTGDSSQLGRSHAERLTEDGGRHQAGVERYGFFPLTPTLSLGERGPCIQSLDFLKRHLRVDDPTTTRSDQEPPLETGVVGLRMCTSPSPQPSPQGRGRIISNPSAESKRSGLSRDWMPDTLSPRERAGVRGKETLASLLCSIRPEFWGALRTKNSGSSRPEEGGWGEARGVCEIEELTRRHDGRDFRLTDVMEM